ncbi:MAG: Rid family hydrolase [Planctomycetota bacterium]|jgi:enamine deaminase RidA (YjgF/YER057c/UK114 family)
MPVDVRKLEGPKTAELYLTATPDAGDAATQAQEVFVAVADALRQAGGNILQERVFFSPGCADVVSQARADVYGNLDDGVPPALLHVDGNADGSVTGVQVHAAVGVESIEIIEVGGRKCGRAAHHAGQTLLAVAGLDVATSKTRTEQARQMLIQAEQAVKIVGGDMSAVARTWMWLADLLDWYDDFNAVRNEFFQECGLLTKSGKHRLPASTGIGVGPASGGHCAMDMVALVGQTEPFDYFLAGGDQGSAFDYGSAFSRALKAQTLAGETIYVSGTAAIDEAGITEHVGDAEAQISDTIKHARAVLAEANCGDADVVQSMIYCKTPEVERHFRRMFGDLSWPQVISICDVCRHDLLFEVEVMACPDARPV